MRQNYKCNSHADYKCTNNNHGKKKPTKTQKVLNLLSKAEESWTTLRNRFDLTSPRTMIDTLRSKGHMIFINETSRGTVYRMGKPTKAILAAMYQKYYYLIMQIKLSWLLVSKHFTVHLSLIILNVKWAAYPDAPYLEVNMDFHLTQDKNEYLIKPLTNRAKEFTKKYKNMFKIFKLREQHYVISNEHQQKICETIRDSGMDFIN